PLGLWIWAERLVTTVLFSALPQRWTEYEAHLRRAFDAAGLDIDLSTRCDPSQVDYIIHAPNAGLSDFSAFPRLKAVLSLWAGVEDIVDNPTLKVPLTRMVDPGLTEGMVEWVTGHVLRHHLRIDDVLARQDGSWARYIPPLARHRSVGILGLGALGLACAEALVALNFQVLGWARREKSLSGVETHFGADGLTSVLSRSEILVLLLPLTENTENTLNAETIATLPRGAVVLNPGRGGLIDDAALLDALNSGHIAQATLDVFRTEPLPADHPFWSHPQVTVCPHIASETRPETAADVIADNIRRHQAGEHLLHLVDRGAGY
ncbi:MAG: glyoxylate/hydroxypyruvate reductase A, partial [Pseudomonadota bacterium]